MNTGSYLEWLGSKKLKYQNRVYIFHLSFFLEIYSYAKTKEVKMESGKNYCYKRVWSSDFSIMLQSNKFLSSNEFHTFLLVINPSLLSSV